jgi:GNAT superfamily N-acetyltransferase
MTPMLDFRPIEATQHIADAWHILEEHREELATDKVRMVLKPDLPVYIKLEDNNALLSIGAFDGDQIVGYSVSIISPNLHYSDLVMCQNDVLYLQEGYRTGPYGLKLIRETERLAKARGCHMMLWHAKMDTQFMALLAKLGYRVQDVIYSRGL